MIAATAEDRVAVIPLRRPGGRPPLFFICAPDVNALGLVALARRLDPAESPCAVQARRTGWTRSHDLTPEEVEALASSYLSAVRARQPSGPYTLASMCEGAHIAFVMARRLSAMGERVALLAVLDTWPVENTSRYPLVVLASLGKKLRPLDTRARIAWLARAGMGAARSILRRLTGAQAAGDPSARARWRARVWPGRGFTPPRYNGTITVLRVRRQPSYRVRDRALGWGAWCAEVRVHDVPGDHATLLREPHVAAVARTLAACLAGAREAP